MEMIDQILEMRNVPDQSRHLAAMQAAESYALPLSDDNPCRKVTIFSSRPCMLVFEVPGVRYWSMYCAVRYFSS